MRYPYLYRGDRLPLAFMLAAILIIWAAWYGLRSAEPEGFATWAAGWALRLYTFLVGWHLADCLTWRRVGK